MIARRIPVRSWKPNTVSAALQRRKTNLPFPAHGCSIVSGASAELKPQIDHALTFLINAHGGRVPVDPRGTTRRGHLARLYQ